MFYRPAVPVGSRGYVMNEMLLQDAGAPGGADNRISGDTHLQQYTALTSRIRALSSPQLTDLDSAERYRETLVSNFIRIGELARQNRDILQNYYYPLLQSEDPLSGESIAAMRAFSGMLVDAYSMENLDLPIVYLQSKRLLQDAEQKQDVALLIRALDDLVISSYTMMHMTCRLAPTYTVCYEYRDIGLDAARRILEYLEPSRFEQLPDDETKEIVLINARYICTLFERGDAYGDEAINDKDLNVLEHALLLSANPFYRQHAPSYNWTYHNFRTLEYISSLCAFGNVRRFSLVQMQSILHYSRQLKALWQKEKDSLSSYSTDGIIDMLLARASYYANASTKAEYKEALLSISKTRNPDDFSFHSTMIHFFVPLEYLIVLEESGPTVEEEQILSAYYQQMITFLYRMPKQGSLTFILTFLADIMKHFIEVPDGPDFETMCLEAMAALHPQTYVHTLNVADLTACLTSHLIRMRPELFYDCAGVRSDNAVLKKAGEIRDFAYHAALMHDIGKLFIIENILTYERDLFSQEFDMIRAHPAFGADLLTRFERLRPYADIARGHHRFYDNRGGYPADFDLDASPYKTLITVLTCADCLDASTDTVGRSYKKAKTPEEFLQEVTERSGSQYAPYMAELLQRPEVRKDIKALLHVTREQNYRNTFFTLESLFREAS